MPLIPWRHQSDLNPEELEKTYLSFLDEAYRLKALYASKITLLVGMETDYITETDLIKTTEWIRNQKGRIQYIVGSLHHVLETPIDFDKPAYDNAVITSGSVPPNLSQFLENYFESQYRMLQTLKPQVVGHFDLCRLYTPEIRLDEYKSVWELVKRNISFIISYGGLFEVNAASFRKGWETAYPGIEVLKVSYPSPALLTKRLSLPRFHSSSWKTTDGYVYRTIRTDLKRSD
jgi:histidinol-phosphatase (PHP family)